MLCFPMIGFGQLYGVKAECISGDCENGSGISNYIYTESKWNDETLQETYVGEWKDGEWHGFGIHSFEFGGYDNYVGEYKYGLANGMGILFDSGDKKIKYTGEFKDGKRNGQGTYNFFNGSKYNGEYKEDKRNGQGKFTMSDGTVYNGLWENNEFLGKWYDIKEVIRESYSWANGDKYEGEMKDERPHGYGTYYKEYVSEKLHGGFDTIVKVKKGLWENGEFLGE